MKKNVSIIILLTIVTLCYVLYCNVNKQKIAPIAPMPTSTFAQNISETIPPTDTFVEKRGIFTYNDQKMQYLLTFPAGYTKTTKLWPLILFLHGEYLRSQDLEQVKKYGPSWIAEQDGDFSFVVLTPQCAGDEDWVNKSDMLMALVDDVLKNYRIDRDRVYLTGISMGGNGTWSLACRYPEYFAAIAPLASNPQIPDTWDKRLLALPIWSFHGDKDPIFPLKKDEAMISAIRAQGGTPRFTVLPGQGHYIAGVYKNRELYDWFNTHTRKH